MWPDLVRQFLECEGVCKVKSSKRKAQAKPSFPRSIIPLIIALLIPLLLGGLSGLATNSSLRSTWYDDLEKPSWNPPGWVFGPVWTLLYLLMGLASWMIWRARDEKSGVNQALTIYSIQLGLNALWSILFFGLRSPGLALIDVMLLLGAIVATIWQFARISTVSALLLVPYLLWTGFATILNATIWRLNQ